MTQDRLLTGVVFALFAGWLLVGSLQPWPWSFEIPVTGDRGSDASFVVALFRFFDGHNGSVTAAATILMAIFSFLLVMVTGRQARLSRDSIDLARNEFISTNRPRLIVRQFQVDPVLKDHLITIRYSLVNVGNTDGTPKFIASEIGLWNSDHWEKPGIDHVQKKVSLPPIKGGQRVSISSESKFAVTEEQLESIKTGDFIISILGEITYVDAIGTQRRTGFRRAYDRNTDKLIPSPDKDEEYCD